MRDFSQGSTAIQAAQLMKATGTEPIAEFRRRHKRGKFQAWSISAARVDPEVVWYWSATAEQTELGKIAAGDN